MRVMEAVVRKVYELCDARGISVNKACDMSGIAPSTVRGVLNGRVGNTGISTIHKLCDGLNISLIDFFNSDLFDDLEQEIR